MIDNLKNKILRILSGQIDEDVIKANNTEVTDPEYFLKSPRAVGYDTTQEQMSLFLNILFGYDPSRDSLIDIGAGRGDLYDFIREFYTAENFDYYGIEQNPTLSNAAAERYGINLTNSVFTKNTKLPNKDWVVACAYFFETRNKEEHEDLQQLLDEVDTMYNSANIAVAFNLLSPINNDLHEGHFYVHPGLILDMMIERYKYVSIKHNYSNSIYTITIYKY